MSDRTRPLASNYGRIAKIFNDSGSNKWDGIRTLGCSSLHQIDRFSDRW